MKRVTIKLGDIFSVPFDNQYQKYFQYVANDETQLNSDVIRAFKKKYPVDQTPELTEIITGDIEFYAHSLIKLGIKMNLWKKVGNSKELDKVDIYFRDTNDAGHKRGEEPVKISINWYVWQINDDQFTRVGKLTGKYREAEIGVVIAPINIVDRMKTGRYHFVYPGFE